MVADATRIVALPLDMLEVAETVAETGRMAPPLLVTMAAVARVADANRIGLAVTVAPVCPANDALAPRMRATMALVLDEVTSVAEAGSSPAGVALSVDALASVADAARIVVLVAVRLAAVENVAARYAIRDPT